jgi:hypothetical protein
MEYKRMISVTGLPGLFELVASKNDGAIVKSLEDGSVKFVSSRGHNFSHLESIEVYTYGQNVNLIEVFRAMETNDQPLPSEKDSKAINTYFETVYPDMDTDRVYASDKKKMVKWFTILKNAGVELKMSSEQDLPNPDEGEETNGKDDSNAGAPEENKIVDEEAQGAVPSPS